MGQIDRQIDRQAKIDGEIDRLIYRYRQTHRQIQIQISRQTEDKEEIDICIPVYKWVDKLKDKNRWIDVVMLLLTQYSSKENFQMDKWIYGQKDFWFCFFSGLLISKTQKLLSFFLGRLGERGAKKYTGALPPPPPPPPPLLLGHSQYYNIF